MRSTGALFSMRTPSRVTPSVLGALLGCVGADRGDGDLDGRGDGATAVGPLDLAIDAQVHRPGVGIGLGAAGDEVVELLRRVGRQHVAVLVVELPGGVVVDVGEVRDELAVDVVDGVAVEPDPGRAVGCGCGAPGSDGVTVGGESGDGQFVALGVGAVGEGAVSRHRLGGESTVEERGEVDLSEPWRFNGRFVAWSGGRVRRARGSRWRLRSIGRGVVSARGQGERGHKRRHGDRSSSGPRSCGVVSCRLQLCRWSSECSQRDLSESGHRPGDAEHGGAGRDRGTDPDHAPVEELRARATVRR